VALSLLLLAEVAMCLKVQRFVAQVLLPPLSSFAIRLSWLSLFVKINTGHQHLVAGSGQDTQ
jgi:hypothetical protein